MVIARIRPGPLVAMPEKAIGGEEPPPTVPAPLVNKDFISRTMEARMYARHGLIAPVLLVNFSPALLQPTALARPALPANIPAVALQQSVWQRMLPLAPLVKALRTGVPLQTTHVHHA